MFTRVLFYVLISLSSNVKGKFRLTDVWNYDDEAKWPGRKCQYGGKRQSPIDIREDDVNVDFEGEFIRYGPLSFRGYRGVLMTGLNNGLTVQFSSEGDPSIHPVLTGGPLKHTYRLEQLHFHWLSEHAIDGQKYPMEMHFVHVRTDLTVAEALQQKDGLAIVAIFCNVENQLTAEQDDLVQELMDTVPLLLKTGKRYSGMLLDLMKLIEPRRSTYYTYEGSLTSPECNEAVVWVILEKPLVISEAQYRLFGKIGASRQNARSLQPLGHRKVYKTRPASPYRIPGFVTAVTNFIDDIKHFFQNVTRFVNKVL
ncbi:eukaryotic-type carbonic anhydrase domain-containing protein [Phthorimaea operculella]|nr:eukaryotic-type carbonic anhydrase domain-containing protein [Phthorimaea operculella]